MARQRTLYAVVFPFAAGLFGAACWRIGTSMAGESLADAVVARSVAASSVGDAVSLVTTLSPMVIDVGAPQPAISPTSHQRVTRATDLGADGRWAPPEHST